MKIARDCNGYIKIQKNVLAVADTYSGAFHLNDVLFALESLGAVIVERPIKANEISRLQVAAALNRNSFKRDEFPKGYNPKGFLLKRGNGWYVWA